MYTLDELSSSFPMKLWRATFCDANPLQHVCGHQKAQESRSTQVTTGLAERRFGPHVIELHLLLTRCSVSPPRPGHWWWRMQVRALPYEPMYPRLSIRLSLSAIGLVPQEFLSSFRRTRLASRCLITSARHLRGFVEYPLFVHRSSLVTCPLILLKHNKNVEARRLASALFRAFMRRLISPLEDPCINGVGMTSGDGVTHRCCLRYRSS